MITQPPSPQDPESDRPVRRDGFALPVAILVVALLTIGLVASFSATGSEIANVGSQRAQARAYSFAQYGLEQFISRRAENSGGTWWCPHCLAVNGTGSGSARTLVGVIPTVKETLYIKIPRSATDTTTHRRSSCIKRLTLGRMELSLSER